MFEAICINSSIPAGHWIQVQSPSMELNANSNDNNIYFKIFRTYYFEKLEIAITYSRYIYALELNKKTTLYMDRETFDHCFREI